MRVLFTADHLRFGGAERHLVALASGLAQGGDDVSVAYLKPFDELVPTLREAGIKRIKCCQSRGGIDFSAIRALADEIRAFKPQVIVATLQYSLALTCVARMLCGYRPTVMFICHSMEHVRRSPQDRWRFSVYRHFYRLADHVVFVSEIQRNFFHSLGVRPSHEEVIHNGIDLESFSLTAIAASANQLRRQLGFSDIDLVIGMCAGFREEKRQIDLLEALRRLLDQGLPAKVILVGDGLMRPQIEACIANLNLQHDVVLCGFQSDVRPYVAACDIMALTSHAETFPIATLEYMALARPIVASDVGGISEQIHDGENGFLYPAGNIKKLTESLANLANPSARSEMAEKGLSIVKNEFSLPVMVRRFRDSMTRLASVNRDSRLRSKRTGS